MFNNQTLKTHNKIAETHKYADTKSDKVQELAVVLTLLLDSPQTATNV